MENEIVAVSAQPSTKLTKRSFWNRFPTLNERAMRAIIAQGSPALLAGTFAQMQARVDASPFVDVALDQTIDFVGELTSITLPATIDIDGVTLPLRFTEEQAAALLALPTDDEAWKGAE